MKTDKRLTKEEEKIARQINRGDFISSKSFKELARYAKIARATTTKNKTISIRISEADLMKLKTLALSEGLPYQTLISSSLHKLITR